MFLIKAKFLVQIKRIVLLTSESRVYHSLIFIAAYIVFDIFYYVENYLSVCDS